MTRRSNLALLVAGALAFGAGARADTFPLASGSTNVTFGPFSQNATGTVNRVAQYLVEASSHGNGSVNYTNGWENEGSELEVTATPNDYYVFDGWSGTTNTTENPLGINVDKPYDLSAKFLPQLASDGTPYPWLVSYYGDLGTNALETLASSDSDGDGYTAGQEYVAGTSPIDNGDYFKPSMGSQGFYIENSKTNRNYSYDSSTNLLEGFNVGTNWTFGNNSNLLLDASSEGNQKFYRGKVRIE